MKYLRSVAKIILSMFLWFILLAILLPKFSHVPKINLIVFSSLAILFGTVSLYFEVYFGKKGYFQQDKTYLKYLDLVWKCIYWSAIWFIILSIILAIITPDQIVGVMFAMFICPIFGITTAIVKFLNKRKLQNIQVIS